jgi:hypothetical protein
MGDSRDDSLRVDFDREIGAGEAGKEEQKPSRIDFDESFRSNSMNELRGDQQNLLRP